MDVSVDFERFGGHLGANIGPKSNLGAILGAKIDPNWRTTWPQDGPKTAQVGPKRASRGPKLAPRRPKTIWNTPGGRFSRYGVGAGGQLGAQNRPKSVQKWTPKLILSLIPFLIDFGSQNRPKKGPKID